MEENPVWGIYSTSERAGGSGEYRRRTVFFCAPDCKREFDANPAQHAR
jgi:YHS domain-containing protein